MHLSTSVTSKGLEQIKTNDSINNFNEINELSGSLLESKAISRLSNITFLGILSPSFSNLLNFPISSKIYGKYNLEKIDGTRKEHSIAVASILLQIASNINLSTKAKKYAVAWGLTHDIATWPLSHTGEAAFKGTTNIDSNKLREMMICDSIELPASLSVATELKDIGVDPRILLNLFNKNETNLDDELRLIWLIIHSPITPDSLEGMHRSGKIFNIKVGNPYAIANIISKDFYDDLLVEKEKSKLIIKFWRDKAKIYDIINRQDVVSFESSWSLAIQRRFDSISLLDSLLLSEDDIISGINENEVMYFGKIIRYKNPLEYCVYPKNKRVIDGNCPLYKLDNILQKKGKIYG